MILAMHFAFAFTRRYCVTIMTPTRAENHLPSEQQAGRIPSNICPQVPARGVKRIGVARWWFSHIFFLKHPEPWGNDPDPIWLKIFGLVEITNQIIFSYWTLAIPNQNTNGVLLWLNSIQFCDKQKRTPNTSQHMYCVCPEFSSD